MSCLSFITHCPALLSPSSKTPWPGKSESMLIYIPSVLPREGMIFQVSTTGLWQAGKQLGVLRGALSPGSVALLVSGDADGLPSPVYWQGFSQSLQPTHSQTAAWPLSPGWTWGQWTGKGWGYLIPGPENPGCWERGGCKARPHSAAEGISPWLLHGPGLQSRGWPPCVLTRPLSPRSCLGECSECITEAAWLRVFCNSLGSLKHLFLQQLLLLALCWSSGTLWLLCWALGACSVFPARCHRSCCSPLLVGT